MGPFRGCSLRRPAPPGWVQAPSRAWKKEGQALGVLELSPGFVSRRPQQAPLGHRWHCCLDLRTPKARRHGCSRPPPLGPARGLAVCLGIRPLEGGRADRSRLLLFPNTPTQTHQPFSTLRLLQAAAGQSGGCRHLSGQWSWRQRRDAECVWGRAREERASDPQTSPPASTAKHPSPGGRPGSQARAPRLGQAPRLPSRGDHPGAQRSTPAPSRRPPAPLPRPGAGQRVPGRALPFLADTERGPRSPA